MPDELYTSFIMMARRAAENAGISWNIPLRNGKAVDGQGWDLTAIAGATPPPVFRLRSFLSDEKTLTALNRRRIDAGQPVMVGFELSENWKDLIKAAVIDRLLIRRNQPGSVYGATVRPLSVLATCCNDINPWDLAPTSMSLAATIADEIQPSQKLGDDIAGIATWLFDKNHLSARCPLSLTGRMAEQAKEKKTRRNIDFVRKSLSERKAQNKLPTEDAFWEIIRIIHEEKPASFLDHIRFSIIKVLIMTGLRSGESVTIPSNWAQWHDYVDIKGKPAGESGGVSRSLSLRYYGEKQRGTGGDSVALYKTAQHVPKMFEEELIGVLEATNCITQPLRNRLAAQIESGRIFPEYKTDAFVSILEIYTRITGDPFVYQDTLRDNLIREYKSNFDPTVLRRIHERQKSAASGGGIIYPRVRTYFSGRLGSGINKKAPIRSRSGALMERIEYYNAYVRVGEFE